MTDIYLPPGVRRTLRRWLMGRERIKAIDPVRYAMFTTERAGHITVDEVRNLVDCTGYGVLDILRGQDD